MGNILHLSVTPPAKLGFKRVQKRKKNDTEHYGQMNLFKVSSGSSARILSLPSRFGPFEEALQLDEKGDPKAAESYWDAISDGDCVPDAYCNLGILESKDGKTDKAFDCFTKSLKYDPRHLESHYNLANLYSDIGNLHLAREHYRIAAEIEPRFPNIYFNLGLVLAMNDDRTAAVDALCKYKELVSEAEGGKADELLDSLRRSLAAQ